MRPAPRSRHLLAVLVFAAVAAASGYVAAIDTRLSESQMNIASVAAKRHDKDLFSHDPVFRGHKNGLWQFQSPAFQVLMELVLVPSGYQDLTLPFRFLAGIIVMIYLCGMYALLYRQCRSWSISAFVAVLSCKIAWTVEWSYWGVGSLDSIGPAAIVKAFVPMLVLMFLRARDNWNLLLVFACIGLFGNIHLVTSMNLTLILLGVYLGCRRFRPSAWPVAIGCGLAALLGAMLHVLYYIGLCVQMGSAAGSVSAATVSEAFDIAGLRCLYPGMLKSLLKWLPWVAVLAIPAAAVLSRIERFRVRDLNVWVWFIVTGLFVAFGLQGASQLIGVLNDQPPPVIDFVQAASLIMLPLYALFAQAMTNLFRLVHKRRHTLRWACAVFMIVWMIPSDNVRYVRRLGYDLAASFMNEEDKPRKVQRYRRRRLARKELVCIARWARANTDKDAVFITDSIEFRMLSRRSIVASADDVEYIYYLAPWRLADWTARIRKMNSLLNPSSGRADPEALRSFVTALKKEKAFEGAGQWYVILPARAAAQTTGMLRCISKDDWGQHYRLFELR